MANHRTTASAMTDHRITASAPPPDPICEYLICWILSVGSNPLDRILKGVDAYVVIDCDDVDTMGVEVVKTKVVSGCFR